MRRPDIVLIVSDDHAAHAAVERELRAELGRLQRRHGDTPLHPAG
jgi:hypothetical protein